MWEKVTKLVERIVQNNHWRQRECFNLIPSEMTPSLLVKICEICDPQGRYAEHRTMKGREVYFYQGTDFIRDVEQEVKKELSSYFQAPQIEVRPISGQMANEVVFKALVKFINRKKKEPFRRLKSVVNNDLGKGGHLSSQPMGALFNYVEMGEKHKERVFNIPVREDNPYMADVEKLKALILEVQPELIIFGKSMFLHREPVREVADFCAQENLTPLIMFDMAHVLGLYGTFQSPLEEGAHVVTGSTHKTFFGPQRGVVVGDLEGGPFEKLWSHIESRAFPGSTSNHHLGTLLALLMASYEMNAFRTSYQRQVIQNAKAFAKALKEKNLSVEGDPERGYTDTHQVVLRVSQYGSGEEIAKRLEDNNIIVNYQALPDDSSFLKSSGIRMGVQEMTRFGMKEKDFEELAELISQVIREGKNVKDKVKAMRSRFLEMEYCFPKEQALPLVGQIFSSLFPKSEHVKRIVDHLGGVL